MPWDIKSNEQGQFCVFKVGDDEPLKCYDNQDDAEKYAAALYANERTLAEFQFLAASESVERGFFADMINGLLKLLHLKREPTSSKPVQERWMLGEGGKSRTHCEKCIDYANMGWRPIGYFPQQRSETTYCGPDCTCHFEYDDGLNHDYIERIRHWEEWEAWFAAAQKPRSSFFIRRDLNNQWRWFAWPACTAFINRDREIDSRALFDNFIRHIERGAPWPYLTFFHQGEKFKMGEADFVAREGVAYLVSGLFDGSRLAQESVRTLTQETERYWGTSINYQPIGKPYYIFHKKRKIPVYYDGIHKEVSLLPEKAASSLFTAFPIVKENP